MLEATEDFVEPKDIAPEFDLDYAEKKGKSYNKCLIISVIVFIICVIITIVLIITLKPC